MTTMTRLKSEPFATVPNVLTLSRFVMVPLIAVFLLLDDVISRWVPFALFLAAAATDYLDGWIARFTQQSSTFGQVFDPIADKLLVCSTLFVLAAKDELGALLILPALLILWRELLVSGLRDYIAGAGDRIAVVPLAKWKTAVQMAALGFLLVAPASGEAAYEVWTVGGVLLWLAAILSLYTALGYGLAARRVLRA